MNKLLCSLDDFTLENYQEISDALIKFQSGQVDLELQKQASLYSYYHGLMAAAKKRLNDAEADLEKYISHTRAITKENARREKIKMTARDLDDIVLSSDEHIKLRTITTDRALKYELLKGLVKALEQKHAMLIQVSSNRRAETKLYSQ